MSRTRPAGITALAILTGLQGIALIASPFFTTGVAPTTSPLNNSGLGLFVAGFAVFLGIVSLLLAYGLWTLKTWAWQVFVVLEFFTLLRAFLSITQTGFTGITDILGILLPILLLGYFFLSDVRSAFRVDQNGRTV